MLCVSCPAGHPVSVAAGKLGVAVACPCCFAVFHADLELSPSRQARKEEKKTRRSRDDDDDDEDDDEEEEKPRKKKPAAKSKAKTEEPKKDAKPAAKKKTGKKDDDDDDEDEEEEENDDVEPEIVWTPRKRQLKVIRTAMTCYLVSFYAMMGLFIVDSISSAVGSIWFLIIIYSGWGKADPVKVEDFDSLVMVQSLFLYVLIIPALVVLFGSLMIAWVMGAIFSPTKSEGKGISMLAIGLFVGAFALFGIYYLFAYAVITRDLVAANLFRIVAGISFLFVMASFYCGLIFLGRMASFMGRVLDGKKTPALGWFIIGGYIARVAGTIAFIIVASLVIGILPLLVLIGIFIFVLNSYYFVLNTLRELIGIAVNARNDIDKYILEA